TAHANVSGDVVRLGFADQRVQQETVNDFERTLDDVLVGAVNGIASLKGDDAAPAFLLERLARLLRVQAVGGELRIARAVEQADLTAQQPVALLVERRDAGVRGLRG